MPKDRIVQNPVKVARELGAEIRVTENMYGKMYWAIFESWPDAQAAAELLNETSRELCDPLFHAEFSAIGVNEYPCRNVLLHKGYMPL